MITRLWRGWTPDDSADAYERFLFEELSPSMREIEGFLGAEVLRSADSDEVAFVVLTRFESLEAIRRFAGEDYLVPVVEPAAAALLSRYDGSVAIYESSAFNP